MKRMSLTEMFKYLHNNPPLEVFRALNLNPDYDPQAKGRWEKVNKFIELTEPYASREDRKEAWKTEYERLKSVGE